MMEYGGRPLQCIVAGMSHYRPPYSAQGRREGSGGGRGRGRRDAGPSASVGSSRQSQYASSGGFQHVAKLQHCTASVGHTQQSHVTDHVTSHYPTLSPDHGLQQVVSLASATTQQSRSSGQRHSHNFTLPGKFHQPPMWGHAHQPPLLPGPRLVGANGFALSAGPVWLHPPPPLPLHSSHPHHYHTGPTEDARAHSPRNRRRSLQRPMVTVSRPLELGGGAAPPPTVSVLTYNVLAQSLIEKNTYLYQDCTEGDLQWENRRQLLLRELAEARADVLCLQEVEEEHYHKWFAPKLSELGYLGLYKKRTGSHGDGCAVFYRTAHLQLAEWKGVEFQRGVKVLDRDNVAIVAKFKVSDWSGDEKCGPPMFCVATTHLLYNPRAGEVKLAQLACLLAELDVMTTSSTGPRVPCVLCGDMNSIPLSPLLRFIETGSLDYSQLTGSQVAGYYKQPTRNRPIPTPLLPPHLHIGQDCQFSSPAWPDLPSQSSSPAPTKEPPTSTPPRAVLSHPFLLSPAYPRPSAGTPPSTVTTFHQSAFETVDYIHYTPWDPLRDREEPSQASGEATSPHRASGFQLLGRRALLSSHTLLELGPPPHHLLPSDHLWLLAHLQLLWT